MSERENRKKTIVLKGDEIAIKLDSFDITYESVDTSRCVALNDIAGLFSEDIIFSTGILPIGVRCVLQQNNKVIVLYEEPPKKRIIKYHCKEGSDYITYENVCMPGCLWYITFDRSGKNYNVNYNLTCCFATKAPIYNIYEDKLYNMITPNIYDHYNICWADCTFQKFNSLLNIVTVAETFFGSIFNRDLWGSSFNIRDNFIYNFSTKEIKFGDIRPFLEKLKNKKKKDENDDNWSDFITTPKYLFEFLTKVDSFPNEILKDSNYTVENFLKKRFEIKDSIIKDFFGL